MIVREEPEREREVPSWSPRARMEPDSRRPRVAALYLLTLVLACAWASSSLPLEWAPSPQTTRVSVVASWQGAPPRVVERYVAVPIERVAAAISGTGRISSYSRTGVAVIEVELTRGADLALYLIEMGDRLSLLRKSLPGTVVPRIVRHDSQAVGRRKSLMIVQLAGWMSPGRLRSAAERTLGPPLRGVPGVAGVSIEGGEEDELLLRLDGSRLEQYGLVENQLVQLLSEELRHRSFGWLQAGTGRSLLFKSGLSTVEPLAGQTLAWSAAGAPVRVGEVARVSLGASKSRTVSRVDGQAVITLRIDRLRTANVLDLSKRVRRAMSSVEGELPRGVRMTVVDDESWELRRRLSALSVRFALSLALICLVLSLLLRKLRTVVVVVSAPLAMLCVGAAALRLFDLSLNAVTLSMLALLFLLLCAQLAGLVEQGMSAPRQAPGERVAQVGMLLVTAVPLLPLLQLEGDFGALVSSSLLAGLSACGIALLIITWIVSRFRRAVPGSGDCPTRRRRSLVLGLFSLPSKLALRFPSATLLVLALVVGSPTVLLPERLDENRATAAAAVAGYNRIFESSAVRTFRRHLDPLIGGVTRSFAREVELGSSWSFEAPLEVGVTIGLPPGSGPERAEELVQRFERSIAGMSALERTIATVQDDAAWLRVVCRANAHDGALAIRERLISVAIHLSGVEVAISGLLPLSYFSGLGDVAGITLEAYGPDYDRLEKVGLAFAKRVETRPGVARVDLHGEQYGRAVGRDFVQLHWSAEATARTGVPTAGLTTLVRSDLLGSSPVLHASWPQGVRLPVRIDSQRGEAVELQQLLAKTLKAPDGRALRLDNLADVREQRDPPVIERSDHMYKRHLSVLFRGPRDLGKQIVALELRHLKLPPGYLLKPSREEENLLWVEHRGRALALLAGAAVLLLLVAAALLESWSLGGLVLTVVPTSWIGVAAGFIWSGACFTEAAWVGTLLSIAASASVGVLVVSKVHGLGASRAKTPKGLLALLAVRRTWRSRLALTSTIVAGLLPLLLLPGTEGLGRELAISLVGGVASSFFLTPIAIVALLALRSPR